MLYIGLNRFLQQVESIVLKRYGKEAFRIFRSLSNGRPLDTDKVLVIDL